MDLAQTVRLVRRACQNDRISGAGPRQAMVFQAPVLLRRSVAANIDFVLRRHGLHRGRRRERVADLLREGGLVAKATHPARRLSRADAQRLAVLRAVATDPLTLFLDDPTKGLDAASTLAIEALIQHASAQGARVIMASHDMSQARRLGRDIVLMRGGRVIDQGRAEDLLDRPVTAAGPVILGGLYGS